MTHRSDFSWTPVGFRCARGELWAVGIPPPSRQPRTVGAWEPVPAGTYGQPGLISPLTPETDGEGRGQFSEIAAKNTSQVRLAIRSQTKPPTLLLSRWAPVSPRGPRNHREPQGPCLSTCLAPTDTVPVSHKIRARLSFCYALGKNKTSKNKDVFSQ